MKAKNILPVPTSPQNRSCEKCGTETSHDGYIMLDSSMNKWYLWDCRQCKNRTAEYIDKFEPN